jgi:tetratricopeptide (TPR) repeat protein
MRLFLEVPETWEQKQGPSQQQLALLRGADGKPELILTYGELVLLPDEQVPWIEQSARSDLQTGTMVQLGSSVQGQTTAGWPVRIVEAQVQVAKTKQPLEVRLCAFYAFLEHGAVAILRAGEPSRFEAHREQIMKLFHSARPDWKRIHQPMCLHEFWDLAADRDTQLQEPIVEAAPAAAEGDTKRRLEEHLGQLDAELAQRATALRQIARGRLLTQLGRMVEAIAAFQAALELAQESPQRGEAQRLLGTALASIGRDAEAMQYWEAALRTNPDDVDARYNLAQAQYNLGQFASALANWKAVGDREAEDFLTLRKVVQTLHALERYEEAEAVRKKLVTLWKQSDDPRARLLSEYVIDQFRVGPFLVHAVETVNPANPGFFSVFEFRLYDTHGHVVPFEVLIETSDYARQAGVPFVLGVKIQGRFRGLRTTSQLPPYVDLKKAAIRLIQEAGLPEPHVHA